MPFKYNNNNNNNMEKGIIFNDVLNTFYYDCMAPGDYERGTPLPPLHGLLFPIGSKGSFIRTITQTAHTTDCVTPVVEQ